MSSSIPISPPSGKDPPAGLRGATPSFTQPNEAFPRLSLSPPTTTIDSAALSSMPPPPRPHSTSISSQNPPAARPRSTSTSVQQPSLQPQIQPSQTPQRPSFSPFFTLISSTSPSSTTTTHHPSQIHYLFSDDDSSHLLSSACIRSLSTFSPPHSAQNPSSPTTTSLASSQSLETSSSSSATYRKPSSSRKPLPTRRNPGEREERVIILDVNETGDRVIKASCLSENWQITNVRMEKAPTWDGNAASEEDDSGANGKGLMLKIEGIEGPDLIGGEEKEEGAVGEEEMALLLEGFDKKMGVLRKVLEGMGTGLAVDGEVDLRREGEGEKAGEDGETGEQGRQAFLANINEVVDDESG